MARRDGVRIDDQAAILVRENLAAVIAGDPGRWTAATQALADGDDRTFEDAVNLCFTLDDQLLRDLHDGPPRPDGIASLAESVARMEAWSNLDQSTAWRFLMALAQSRDPFEVLSGTEAVQTGFIVGGWLLSAFTPPNLHWEEVLDEALNALDRDLLLVTFTS